MSKDNSGENFFTVKAQLDTIVNPLVRERALNNMVAYIDRNDSDTDYAFRSVDSISGALLLAFDWEHTSEGYDYWAKQAGVKSHQ